MSVRFALFGIIPTLLIMAARAPAADPPPVDALPAPRAMPGEMVMPPDGVAPSPMYLRASRYDVWQYYGVARNGMWRARVIYGPSGAYYLYNGQPFPWTATHQLEFNPVLYDTPYPRTMPYADD
jgi:hypothetical protein